jgi:hypothetical protein
LLEESCDAVRASEPDNLDARRRKVEAASLSQRFDRDLIAYTLNDHHRVHVGPIGSHIHCCHPMNDQSARGFLRWAVLGSNH